MESLNRWLEHWEALWLFAVLVLELLVSCSTLYVVTLEYFYDARKDEAKKQRRTKTSKKTTVKPSGEQTVEETTETEGPAEESK